MDKQQRNNSDFFGHLKIAVTANLISAGLLAGAYFVERPALKVAACGAAVLTWGVLAYLIRFIVRPNWERVRQVGHYFILTWPFFWIFDLYRGKLAAEKEVARLNGIIEGWPAASIANQIINPASRREGLETLLVAMDNRPDRDLALIIDRLRYCAEGILEPGENREAYDLFRELIGRLSLYEPDGHTQAFESLLRLLSDVYEMQRTDISRRQVQRDMIAPLKNVVRQTDNAHLDAAQGVVEKIMLDNEDDHELACAVLEMLSTLDPKVQRPIWQLIFNECKKRAFMFPERFGRDFLHRLNELGYKVFWLDFHSLRHIWTEPPPPGRKGLIDSNQAKFNEMCAKVFATIEDPRCSGVRRGRVFKRLTGDLGKATVDCILPNGETCRCEGESLSLRGIFSKKCIRGASETFRTKIVPLLEHDRHFDLTASVAKLHTDEHGNEVQGRGIFFEEAEEPVVRSLYEYISNR